MKSILSLLTAFLISASVYSQDSSYYNPYKAPTIDHLAYDINNDGPQRIDWWLRLSIYIQTQAESIS